MWHSNAENDILNLVPKDMKNIHFTKANHQIANIVSPNRKTDLWICDVMASCTSTIFLLLPFK